MARRERETSSLWPSIRAIDGHLILGEREVLAVFSVASNLNPVTADSRDCEAAVRRLQAALDNLAPGERVQAVVECGAYDPSSDIRGMRAQISESARPDFRGFYPDLLEDYVRRYCAASLVPEYRFHLLFGYRDPAAGRDAVPALKASLGEVRRRSEEFIRALNGPALDCRPLGRDAIVELLDASLNPSRAAALPPGALDLAGGATGVEAGPGELLLRSPVLHSDLAEDPRHSRIQLGRRLVRTLGFLRAPLPDSGAGAAVADLMLSQREFRFTFFAEGMSQDKAAQLVRKKRAEALGAVTFGEGKETQAVEEQAAQYDALLRAHARKEMRFVGWSAYLGFTADGDAILNQASTDLGATFRALVPDEGILRQVPYWQSTVPLGTDFGGNKLMAQTDAVASLFPFFRFRSTSPEGGALLGFSPANEPCFFDPWSRSVTNGNVFVTGQAGSGKSYLINLIVNRLGMRAFDVSFIDRAKSYRHTCMALGGDYIEFALEGTQAVNIWDVLEHDPGLEEAGLNDLDGEGKVQADKVEQVAGCLEIVLAESGGQLPKLERALLLEDIARTYARCLRFGGPARPGAPARGALQADSVPLFTDLAETFKARIADPAAEFQRERRELLQKMQPVVSGHLAGLLNRRTTLAAGALARVFDLSNLPDQPAILGAAMYVLTAWLYRHWRRNKARDLRQVVVFDEIYSFMGFESGRRLLDALARRSRHMGLMPFFATQQLSDVLDYRETRAILDNCQTQFLFSQPRNVVERVADILSLSDRERRRLENLRQVRGVYSSAFFVHGSQRNILTIRPDPATRWLGTSEPTYDLPRMRRALESAGGDVWQAVRSLMQAGA